MRDGPGLPPTGSVLVSTGLALLRIPPLALSLALAGVRSHAGQPSLPWTLVAGATGFLSVLSAAFLVVYAVYVRLRDRVVPGSARPGTRCSRTSIVRAVRRVVDINPAAMARR